MHFELLPLKLLSHTGAASIQYNLINGNSQSELSSCLSNDCFEISKSFLVLRQGLTVQPDHPETDYFKPSWACTYSQKSSLSPAFASHCWYQKCAPPHPASQDFRLLSFWMCTNLNSCFPHFRSNYIMVPALNILPIQTSSSLALTNVKNLRE